MQESPNPFQQPPQSPFSQPSSSSQQSSSQSSASSQQQTLRASKQEQRQDTPAEQEPLLPETKPRWSRSYPFLTFIIGIIIVGGVILFQGTEGETSIEEDGVSEGPFSSTLFDSVSVIGDPVDIENTAMMTEENIVTYTNTQFGFHITHPEDYVLQKNPLGPLLLSPQDIASRQNSNTDLHSTFLHIIIERRTLPTLEDWIKEKFKLDEVREFRVTPEESNFTVDEIQKVQVGEVVGYAVHRWEGSQAFCDYMLKNKNLFIQLQGQDPTCVDDPTFRDVVSTFTFTP